MLSSPCEVMLQENEFLAKIYKGESMFMGLCQMLHAAQVPRPREIVRQSRGDQPILIQTCGDEHVGP